MRLETLSELVRFLSLLKYMYLNSNTYRWIKDLVTKDRVLAPIIYYNR